MKTLFVILALIPQLFVIQHALAQDLQRGYRNYQEILRGTKKFEQLSAEEQREVIIVLHLMKSRGSDDDSSDCRDAKERANRVADDLAIYARRLQSCAENKYFSDDCSSEFNRVRSAHSDYDGAVSDVRNYCR
jgi:hypothetical protein